MEVEVHATTSGSMGRRSYAADVPDATLVRIGPGGDSIALDIAGIGSVTATANEWTCIARDLESHRQLESLASQWAWGQQLALAGTFAFHGAIVERDGTGLAIFGAPRAGTSLAALALCRRGWRLISDGTCPLEVAGADDSAHVVALPGIADLQVDRAVTAAFPPDEDFGDAGTPRARSSITVATTGPHRIDRIVVLMPSNLRRNGVVVPGDHEGGSAVVMLEAHAVVGEALRAANTSLDQELRATCARMVELVPLEVALVPAGSSQSMFDPGMIATLISDHVAGGPTSV